MTMPPATDDHDGLSVRDVREHADLDLDLAAQERTVAHVRRMVDGAPARAPVVRRGATRRLVSTGRWAPALVAVVAVVAAVVAVVANESSPPSDVQPVREGIPSGPPARSFALLRQSSREPMPEGVRRLLSHVGAPVASAKSIELGFDRPGWALSSAERVCIVVPDTLNGAFAGYGSSCAPRARAQTSGVSDTRRHSDAPSGPDPQEVFALIPDGVDEVTVTSSDGASRDVAVQRNVLRVAGRVGDRITFRDADGRVRNLLGAEATGR